MLGKFYSSSLRPQNCSCRISPTLLHGTFLAVTHLILEKLWLLASTALLEGCFRKSLSITSSVYSQPIHGHLFSVFFSTIYWYFFYIQNIHIYTDIKPACNISSQLNNLVLLLWCSGVM